MSSAPDITIRSAALDDLAPIFHLGERVFTSQTVSNLYRTWDEYEVTNLFNLEGEHFVVAEADGRVIGFAMGATIEKARSAWKYGHLVWLGVDPAYARCGVGRRLFEEFRARMEAQGVRMLLVDTQADNEAALRFFRRMGFENPTDHVYLTLNLEKVD